MEEFDTTTLDTIPTGCGCSACRDAAQTDNGASALSSDYVGASDGTLSAASSLLSGSKWSGLNLTYKFLTSLPSYYSSSADEANNFQAFTPTMKAATERILDQLESFTNLTFTETSGTSQLTFAQATLPTDVGAWAYYPSINPLGGDVWTNNYYSATTTPAEGNYGFYTLLHEIGHAMGLIHSFSAGFTGEENTTRYTVMAYDWSPFYPSSYMVYDIAALQKLYGANMAHETGDTVYTLNPTKAYTVWDAGGNDTFDASALSSSVTLDLRDGEYSSVGMNRNIGIAYNAIIENANGGSGNDLLIGNDAANILNGNAGNDIFIASDGNDIIDGGSGSDRIVYDLDISNFLFSLIDSVTLRIQDLSGTYHSDIVTNIESFEFADTTYDFATLSTTASPPGSAEHLGEVSFYILTSNGRWNALTSDIETLDYVSGTDLRYRSTDTFLSVLRTNDNGTNELRIQVNEDYQSVVRALKLSDLGSLEDLYASGFRNVSISSSHTTHDVHLDISGAYSASLTTGSGNDTIMIDTGLTSTSRSVQSIVTGDGNDDVTIISLSSRYSYASVSLGAGDDHLHMTTIGSVRVTGDDGNDTITTGSGNDRIFGGNGDDVIDAGDGNNIINAGQGNNTITSGSGNDRIYCGDGDDVIDAGDGNNIIFGGTGRDTITTGSGNDWITTGNGNDIIHAGDGHNRISTGDGNDIIVTGAGNDRIFSGTGNDMVSGGAGNDLISDIYGYNVLNGGDGNDRIAGSGTLNGNEGNDIISGYKYDDILIGGDGNDRLLGGDGNDFLNGGDGKDQLYGGRGADIFFFDSLDEVDFVGDFNRNEDFLDLSDLIIDFDPVSSAIADFVQISTVGRVTFLQVDVDGAGTDSGFVTVARIDGLRNADLDQLMTDGHIIAAV